MLIMLGVTYAYLGPQMTQDKIGKPSHVARIVVWSSSNQHYKSNIFSDSDVAYLIWNPHA